MKCQNKKLFLVIILFCAILACYVGAQKEGYYIDELWSYGLANSTQDPFLQNYDGYMNAWHTPEFYRQYLEVEQGEQFRYDVVYQNQVNDVHPPLFYMLLHSVCSIFPEHFSKWSGLAINLIFYLLSLALIYIICEELLGKENPIKYAVLLCTGINIGVLSEAAYIRMYMMLTFWTLLFVLCTLRLLHKQSVGIYVVLMLSTIGGMLTQYYFVIFAFFLSLYALVYFLWKRRWKDGLLFGCSASVGVIISVCIFPAALHHIFAGEKSQESVYTLKNSLWNFLPRFREFDRIVSWELWNSRIPLQWLFLCVFVVLAVIFLIRHSEKSVYAYWSLLALTVASYYMIIVLIATDIVDRYQFIVFPIEILLILVLIRNVGKVNIVMIGLYLILCCFSLFSKNVNYLYTGYQEALTELNETYHDVPGIYVTTGDHLVISDCLFLIQQDNTYPLTAEQVEELPDLIDSEWNQLVVYVNIYYDEEETAQKIADLCGYRKVTHFYDNVYSQIYVLSK